MHRCGASKDVERPPGLLGHPDTPIVLRVFVNGVMNAWYSCRCSFRVVSLTWENPSFRR